MSGCRLAPRNPKDLECALPHERTRMVGECCREHERLETQVRLGRGSPLRPTVERPVEGGHDRVRRDQPASPPENGALLRELLEKTHAGLIVLRGHARVERDQRIQDPLGAFQAIALRRRLILSAKRTPVVAEPLDHRG